MFMVYSGINIFRGKMISLLRYSAYNMLLLWKKYKLTDWISLLVAALIFISGYVLGTMSWRRGASGFFVMLDFFSGSVGFFYFCFKGLKIFSDANEELIGLIYKERAQLDTREKSQAEENDYVYGHTIFNSKQESKLEDRTTYDVCEKDRFQQRAEVIFSYEHELEEKPDEVGGIKNQKSVGEINSVRINSPHYENGRNREGRHILKFNTVNQEGTESSDGMYINLSPPEIQTKQQKELETENYSTPRENKAFQEFHLSNQTLCDRKINGGSSISYPGSSSESLPFSESYQSPLTIRSSSFVSFPEPTLRNFKAMSQEHLSSRHEQFLSPNKEQRGIQNSTSEYVLSSMHNDFTQHYQIPRAGSLSFDILRAEDLSPPDPRRHLKPAKGIIKPLPPLPTPQNLSNYSELSESPTSLCRHDQSSLSADISPSGVSTGSIHSILSESRPFQCPHRTVRVCEPLARQLSHPLILEACSFQSSQTRKCQPLTRLFSHPLNSETRPSSSKIPSPPPRARPSPPLRTRINMSMQNLEESPPPIPRKSRSFL